MYCWSGFVFVLGIRTKSWKKISYVEFDICALWTSTCSYIWFWYAIFTWRIRTALQHQRLDILGGRLGFIRGFITFRYKTTGQFWIIQKDHDLEGNSKVHQFFYCCRVKLPSQVQNGMGLEQQYDSFWQSCCWLDLTLRKIGSCQSWSYW